MKKLIVLIAMAALTSLATDIIPTPGAIGSVGNSSNVFATMYATNFFGGGAGLTGVTATVPVGATNYFTPTNDTTWFIPQSTRVALTNGYLRSISVTDTNVFVATNNTTWFDRASDRTALTNGYLRAISTGDTNGYLRAISITDTNYFTATSDVTWFIPQSTRVALTNGYLRAISVADTNGYIRAIAITDTNTFTTTNNTVWFLRQDQRVALTNGFITLTDIPKQTNSAYVITNGNTGNGQIVYATNSAPGFFWAAAPSGSGGITHGDWTNDYAGNIIFATNKLAFTNESFWFDRASDRVSLTNGYIRGIAVGDTNQFMPKIISGTSAFFSGNNSGGIEVAITNADSSSWSGFTAQSDTGSFVTNYFGMFINNSAFVPGSTYAGTTNDAVLEMAAGNFIVDMIGGNAHWFFITRQSTNGTMTTNWDLTASALNFKTQPQFSGANLITGIAVTDTNTYTATNDTRSLSLRAAANLFSGAFAGMGSGLTNLNWGNITNAPAFIAAIAVTDTNKLLATNYTGNTFVSGTAISSNGFYSTVSNSFPLTTVTITASITNFFTNTFGKSILVGYSGITITGLGMTGTNAGVGGDFKKWMGANTNGTIGLRPNHVISITNGATAGNLTWEVFP